MSKANRLKEKKKALKDEENKGKEAFKLEIIVDDNDNISVNGPINDPLLVMKLLAGAMNVIVDYNFSPEKARADVEASREKKNESRIIRPVQ
jgi:hypothetical protein